MILSLSGVDASGKHTQTVNVATELNKRGIGVEMFDFPRYQGIAGGVVGRILRGELLVVPYQEALDAARSYSAAKHRPSSHDPECGLDENPGDFIDDLRQSWTLDKGYVIQSIMLADRHEFIDLLRRYDDTEDQILVLDRYYLDGFVYGQADGVDLDWLETVHDTLPKPDVAVLVDISLEESLRRRPERRDYYEKNTAKLEKVINLYRREWEKRQMVESEVFHVVDGSQPREVVTETILNIVLRRRQEMKL